MKKVMFLMVMAFVVLLAMPVVSVAFPCGENGGTCSDTQCCCAGVACCKKEYNLYCSSSNMCYNTIAGAEADCGDDYTVCSVPADEKRLKSKSKKFQDEGAKDASLVGILVKEQGEYRLKLIKPIYFDKGSRSERIVKSVKLIVPAGLQEATAKLLNRYVAAAGPMKCTMYTSPWTASCEMAITKIRGIK